MFRQLPKRLFVANGTTLVFNDADPEENARGVLRTHPLELAAYLEAYWAGGHTVSNPGNKPLGHPNFLSAEPATTRVPLPNGQMLLGAGTETSRATSPLGPLDLRVHDREHSTL